MQLYQVIGRINGSLVLNDDSEEERERLWRAIKRKTIAKTQIFNDSLGDNHWHDNRWDICTCEECREKEH